MTPDEELRLRLRLVWLEQDRTFIVDAIGRLLAGAHIPEGATSKNYGTKDQKVVKARHLATLAGIFRRREGD